MINVSKPLECISADGTVDPMMKLQAIGNIIWVIESEIQQGNRVKAYLITTGERCSDAGELIPTHNKLRNASRRVYVNLYDNGSAEYFDNKEAANFASQSSPPSVCCIADAVPIDLPSGV